MAATQHDTRAPTMRTLRILCLHGYTQSGPLFRAKTRALEKYLQKAFPPAPKPGSLRSYPGGVEFHYITAPHKLAKADLPTFERKVRTDASPTRSKPDSTARFDGAGEDDAWGWWRRKQILRPSDGTERAVYVGLPDTLDLLARTLEDEGPFDGVLGFSQGAALAIMFAALLEEGRAEGIAAAVKASGEDALLVDPLPEPFGRHGPLRFAVSYSGFRAQGDGYDEVYRGGLSTPTLHFIGSVDTVVDEARSLESLEACRAGGAGAELEARHRVVYHPGGHFVPAGQRPTVDAVIQFIKDIDGDTLSKAQEEGEERVEDMDMPF